MGQQPENGGLRNTFARQTIPMAWDFAEGNPFSDSSGNWTFNVEWVTKAIVKLPATAAGQASQLDASDQELSKGKVVSTDPPYYDNIGYADLSDFFYVWLRRALRPAFPSLFSTLAVPKIDELVASPYRHDGKTEADAFFLGGMTRALHNLPCLCMPSCP